MEDCNFQDNTQLEIDSFEFGGVSVNVKRTHFIKNVNIKPLFDFNVQGNQSYGSER